MGQHKANPTAIAKANGELPPKPKSPGKPEQRKQMEAAFRQAMFQVSPATAVMAMCLLERSTHDGFSTLE